MTQLMDGVRGYHTQCAENLECQYIALQSSLAG